MSDSSGMLLGTYIWKCAILRRTPSNENVIGNPQEEPLTNTETLSAFDDHIENTANDIFDYDIEVVDSIDGVNSDQVYGNY